MSPLTRTGQQSNAKPRPPGAETRCARQRGGRTLRWRLAQLAPVPCPVAGVQSAAGAACCCSCWVDGTMVEHAIHRRSASGHDRSSSTAGHSHHMQPSSALATGLPHDRSRRCRPNTMWSARKRSASAQQLLRDLLRLQADRLTRAQGVPQAGKEVGVAVTGTCKPGCRVRRPNRRCAGGAASRARRPVKSALGRAAKGPSPRKHPGRCLRRAV